MRKPIAFKATDLEVNLIEQLILFKHFKSASAVLRAGLRLLAVEHGAKADTVAALVREACGTPDRRRKEK